MKLLLGRILRMKEAMGFEAWSVFVMDCKEIEHNTQTKHRLLRKSLARFAFNALRRALWVWHGASKAYGLEGAYAAFDGKLEDMKRLLDAEKAALGDRAASAELALAARGGPCTVQFNSSLQDQTLETFDDAAQKAFVAATALALGVSPSQVVLDSIQAGSVVVGIKIVGIADSSSAAALCQKTSDPSVLAAGLQNAGLGTCAISKPKVSVTEYALTQASSRVHRFVLNMALHHVRFGWNTWRDFVIASLFQEAKVHITDSESKRTEAMFKNARDADAGVQMKRVLRIICASKLRAGWLTWRQCVQRQAQARAKLYAARRALGRLTMAAQAIAWKSWNNFVTQSLEHARFKKVHLSRILRRSLVQMTIYRMRIAWNTWRDCIVAMLIHDLKSSSVTAEQSKSDALIQEARTLEESIRIKHMLTILWSSWLRKGWNTWLHKTSSTVLSRLILTRARKVLSHIVIRVQATAWHSWNEMVLRAREKDKAMKHLLGRILRMKEAMAFEAWSFLVQAARDAMHLAEARAVAMRKITGNMLCARESRALRQWNQFTHFKAMEAAQAVERAKIKLLTVSKKHAEGFTRLMRVMMSVSFLLLRKGWNKWRQMVLDSNATSVSLSRVLRRCLMHMTMHRTRLGWNTWRDYIVAMLIHDVKTRVIATEQSRSEVLIQEVRERQVDSSLRHFVCAMLAAQQRKGWLAWKQLVVVQQQQRRFMVQRKGDVLLSLQRFLGWLFEGRAKAVAFTSWRMQCRMLASSLPPQAAPSTEEPTSALSPGAVWAAAPFESPIGVTASQSTSATYGGKGASAAESVATEVLTKPVMPTSTVAVAHPLLQDSSQPLSSELSGASAGSGNAANDAVDRSSAKWRKLKGLVDSMSSLFQVCFSLQHSSCFCS